MNKINVAIKRVLSSQVFFVFAIVASASLVLQFLSAVLFPEITFEVVFSALEIETSENFPVAIISIINLLFQGAIVASIWLAYIGTINNNYRLVSVGFIIIKILMIIIMAVFAILFIVFIFAAIYAYYQVPYSKRIAMVPPLSVTLFFVVWEIGLILFAFFAYFYHFFNIAKKSSKAYLLGDNFKINNVVIWINLALASLLVVGSVVNFFLNTFLAVASLVNGIYLAFAAERMYRYNKETENDKLYNCINGEGDAENSESSTNETKIEYYSNTGSFKSRLIILVVAVALLIGLCLATLL